jgi:two-component system sensor histidine kinase KdpD
LGERRPESTEYLRATLVVAVTTALAAAARALGVPDVEMLFLLGVMVTALTGRRRASLVGAALAVLCYDFFFVPPPFTLDVADARYLLTFAMMFGVSLVIGTLTLRLREQRRSAEARERRASALYALSRDLGPARDEDDVAGVTAAAAAAAFGEAAFLRRGGGEPEQVASVPAGTALGLDAARVARWVLEHGRAAGCGTDVQGDAPVLCAPVQAWGDASAALVVRCSGRAPLDADERSLLEALARQAALALDRVRLSGEAGRAALRARSEQLRSGLLSAVSHDLRTPLAAITGSATTLRDEPSLDPAVRDELVAAICDEAERLERLVSNLLDMTRLESGAVEPKREWIPVEELVGGALTRLERMLAGRRVVTAVGDELPLVSVDPVLLEQLLVNLLENAAKYSPDGSEIRIAARGEGGAVVLEVSDRGPGIPAGDEERIFERFQRGVHPRIGGAGLGLAIVRAIAQAHGGTVLARNDVGGGAVFRLTLPIPTGAPPADLPGVGA